MLIIADVFKKLGDCSQGIDPYSHKLEITLDLICLTQPSEPDEGDEWKVSKDVKLLRQDSNESFYSSQGHHSPEQRSNSLCSQDERFVNSSSPGPGRGEKINLNFYFHALWCLERFLEGL